MPNHGTNRLQVSGPIEDIQRLAQLLRGNDQAVDFNRIIEMPEELDISPPQCSLIELDTLAGDISGAEECLQRLANEPLSTEASEGFRQLQEEKRRDIPKHLENLATYGYVSWYDWRIALSTRASTGNYTHEMTEEDHRELLATIQDCQGAVLLSGYPNPLYDDTLHDWNRHDFEIDNKASGTTSKRKMTESVWRNF